MRGLLQSLVTGASLLALLACGGGGGGTATPPAPPASPVISSFTAAKTPITAGTSTTLMAAFSNGSGSIDHGVGAVTNGQAVTISPAATTTYQLTVTNSAGASVIQTATVAVVAAPVAQIASTVPADATLTAGAAGFQAEVPDQPGCTYAWTLSGGTLDAGAGTRAVRFSAGAVGTLTLSVTVTNTAGTTQQGTWSRPVQAPPPGVILSAPAEASVDTLDLTASVTPVAGASYQWVISGGTITAGADSSTVSFASGPAAAASGATVAATACGTLILTLTLKLPDGRTFLFSIVIPLACDPNAVPLVPASATAGQSGLVGSVHEQRNCTYTWAVNGGTLTAGQGTHRITFSAGSPGTMTVQCTVRNNSAVSKTGIATVTVLPTATPTIQYTPGIYVLTRGASAPAIAPIVSGGTISAWAIAPALPAGLTFSTLTGAITGTPTTLSPATTYTVSGAHTGGTATTTLSLAVQEAPTGISYPGSPYTLTRGQSIGAIAPVVNGGTPTAWAVSPTLPAGLAFSAATGIISGQPSTLSAATVYTVSATHSGGTFTTDLTLAVVDLAPGIRYTPNNYVFTKGTAIDLITPTNLGGAADSWTIAPGLPAGLSFNSASGQISGTPTALSSSSVYTVRASNSGGTGYTDITLSTNDIPPQFGYPSTNYTFIIGVSVGTILPVTTGGAVLGWGITPTLPTGLVFNTSTGAITGTPTTITSVSTYHVQATNSGGIIILDLSIRVNPPPPSITSQPKNQLVSVGQTATFSVSASGTEPLLYQWKRGETLINGATLPSYTTPPTALADNSSTFSISVSDSYGGSVTSDVAVLSVDYGFSASGNMATGRLDFRTSLLPNGKVLVTGGYDTSSSYLASAELYEPSTGTFYSTGSMTTARAAHTTTLLPNGKVLVVGGQPNGSTYSASAELYDPASGTFTATSAMSRPRGHHTATLLPDGKVLIAGGFDDHDTTSTAELYDPTSGTFSDTGPMTTSRASFTASLLLNGKVLLAGGWCNGRDWLATAELYDASSGTFTGTGGMGTVRGGHTATILNNGKVLFTGSSLSTAYTELYNPDMGEFTSTGPLSFSRGANTATLLPNGKVLIAGGFDTSNSQLSSAELYDPAVGVFAATGPMGTPRGQHKAILLRSGKILVIGGYAGIVPYLNSSELYEPQDPGPGMVMISQYYEGVANDKWIELTNVGWQSIDLNAPQLYLALYSNASADNPLGLVPNSTQTLIGSLAPGASLLFRNSSAVLPAYSTGTASAVCQFNGDDLVILTTATGTAAWANRIDVIGDGSLWGQDGSFFRAMTILRPNVTWTPTEWIQKTIAQVDGAEMNSSERLGGHIFNIQ